ncbi:TetR/AcrR family transcriptional regulator [Kitasatospora sp. NPDC002040]|uniref:TetR/AcrR family transcriptional regulator n=1 Tax=Kitasatospora sp. NPDC002040 TaxID=3154661 RepID=UPI003320C8E8
MTVTAAEKATAPRLRADASRNRARIIAAAREAFVEQGPDVPLDEIARRAGVGNATVYRNFADRRELIHHVTLSVMNRVIGHAEAAMAEEADAFEAVSRFTHAAAEERISALCPMISEHGNPDDPELEETGELLRATVIELITRAQRAGLFRADIGVGDYLIAVTQLTRPLPGSNCLAADDFSHRHLQILLDGMRAPARSELPGRAATLEDLRRSN